jgi:hypothetical protein
MTGIEDIKDLIGGLIIFGFLILLGAINHFQSKRQKAKTLYYKKTKGRLT